MEKRNRLFRCLLLMVQFCLSSSQVLRIGKRNSCLRTMFKCIYCILSLTDHHIGVVILSSIFVFYWVLYYVSLYAACNIQCKYPLSVLVGFLKHFIQGKVIKRIMISNLGAMSLQKELPSTSKLKMPFPQLVLPVSFRDKCQLQPCPGRPATSTSHRPHIKSCWFTFPS